jgi:hypothetical protein
LRINENNRRNLESEIEGFRAESQVQSRTISALEREKEKYAQEAAEASSKYMQALEEVKVRGWILSFIFFITKYIMGVIRPLPSSFPPPLPSPFPLFHTFPKIPPLSATIYRSARWPLSTCRRRSSLTPSSLFSSRSLLLYLTAHS